jgi:hypothetical protein
VSSAAGKGRTTYGFIVSVQLCAGMIAGLGIAEEGRKRVAKLAKSASERAGSVRKARWANNRNATNSKTRRSRGWVNNPGPISTYRRQTTTLLTTACGAGRGAGVS